jgi:hypothetical protein
MVLEKRLPVTDRGAKKFAWRKALLATTYLSLLTPQ